MPPFSFSENKHMVFYHNVRIYIYGADVTSWLTSGVSIKYSDREGISSCSFNLNNQYSAFEITTENVKNNYRLHDPSTPEGAYSELAKFNIFSRKNKANSNVPHSIKAFGPLMEQSDSPLVRRTVVDSNNAVAATTYRYTFNVGSLVFHKYDPVRIYVANPATGSDDEWVCVFSGFIENKSYSQSYLNADSVISVTCQDIRILMQQMRTQINTMTQISNEQVIQAYKGGGVPNVIDAGFFNDLNVPGRQISHILGGRRWLDSIKFLLFSDGSSSRYGRVGSLSEGETKTYLSDEPNRKTKLQDWNDLIIFGTRRRWATKSEMIKEGEGTYTGGPSDPAAGKVHFMLPAQGMPSQNLVNYNVDTQIATNIDWSSRQELIVQLCRSIDYQYYVSAQGDLIFEFPMYDFMPSDFGPAYDALYTFAAHLTSDSINDEAGSPISALEVSGNRLTEYTQGPESENNPTGRTDFASAKRVIFSNVMASRFGIQVETMQVPGVINRARLAQIGAIEFNKRLANFNTFAFETEFRPFLQVNRPMYHKMKVRVGVANSISYSWNVRGDATTSVDLQYVRKQELDGRWRFITGGEAAPISYAYLYRESDVMVPGQGISADGENGGPPTSSPVDSAQ